LFTTSLQKMHLMVAVRFQVEEIQVATRVEIPGATRVKG
jgi:hypothetical protein